MPSAARRETALPVAMQIILRQFVRRFSSFFRRYSSTLKTFSTRGLAASIPPPYSSHRNQREGCRRRPCQLACIRQQKQQQQVTRLSRCSSTPLAAVSGTDHSTHSLTHVRRRRLMIALATNSRELSSYFLRISVFFFLFSFLEDSKFGVDSDTRG